MALKGTPTDTGPLLALLNASDPANARCVAALPFLYAPLITVEACVTETLYFLGRMNGYAGQAALWEMISTQRLIIADLTAQDRERAQFFMETYRDRPCDYADACLVTLCEREGMRRVFSIDSDFYIYRLADGGVLELLPGPAGR